MMALSLCVRLNKSRQPIAHARLMMRDEITVQDAIVAVAVMECSMQVSELWCGSNLDSVAYPQGAALLGSIDALH